MSDERGSPGPELEPGPGWDEDPELVETRALLASVEELRALLAPLSDGDRERVLELARYLKQHPGAPAPTR